MNKIILLIGIIAIIIISAVVAIQIFSTPSETPTILPTPIPKNGEYLRLKSDYSLGEQTQAYLIESNLYYGTYSQSFTHSGSTGIYEINAGDSCVIINGTIRSYYDKDLYFAITANVINSQGNPIGPILTADSPIPGYTLTKINSDDTGTFDLRIKYDAKDILDYDILLFMKPTEEPPP